MTQAIYSDSRFETNVVANGPDRPTANEQTASGRRTPAARLVDRTRDSIFPTALIAIGCGASLAWVGFLGWQAVQIVRFVVQFGWHI